MLRIGETPGGSTRRLLNVSFLQPEVKDRSARCRRNRAGPDGWCSAPFRLGDAVVSAGVRHDLEDEILHGHAAFYFTPRTTTSTAAPGPGSSWRQVFGDDLAHGVPRHLRGLKGDCSGAGRCRGRGLPQDQIPSCAARPRGRAAAPAGAALTDTRSPRRCRSATWPARGATNGCCSPRSQHAAAAPCWIAGGSGTSLDRRLSVPLLAPAAGGKRARKAAAPSVRTVNGRVAPSASSGRVCGSRA